MYKLVNGDCLQAMNEIEDKSIDMILCDLPYGTTQCKWDVVIPFDKLWEHYKRIIKDNGCIALFGSEPFSSNLRLSNIKWYKYDWIWDKVNITNPMMAKKQPLRNYENICIFYNKQTYYHPQKEVGKQWSRGGKKEHSTDTLGKSKLINTGSDKTNLKYPKSIITFSNANRTNNVHPTQKPVSVLEYLIRTYTQENESILDNCMGSGSTGIACINTRRKFIGIEKDEKYFEIAKNRIKQHLDLLKHSIVI